MVVIFGSEKLNSGWALGVDIVADWDKASAVKASAAKLNHSDQTANDLLTEFQNAKSKKEGIRNHIISKLQPEGVLCKHTRFLCFTDGIHLKHI